MAPAISFRKWFKLTQELRGLTDLQLRRWLVGQLDERHVTMTERGLRAIVDEKHEPRRELRAALMEITGLPATSFLLPVASPPASDGTEAA